MRSRTGLVAALACLFAFSLLSSAAFAQSGVEVARNETTVQFPQSITFRLVVDAASPIVDAELRYRIPQLSCGTSVATGLPAVAPGRQQDIEWTMDLRQAGGLPVGARTVYWWALTTADGQTVETPERTLVFEDPRFSWRAIEGHGVTLRWHAGSEAFARGLLETAEDALRRLEAAAGVRPSRHVDVRVYESADAMRGALVFSQEWTGGVAFPAFGLVTIGIGEHDLEWGARAMTHELAHLVMGDAAFFCGSHIPTWLNEGIAVHAEGELSSGFASRLAAAITADEVYGVRSLAGGFPANPDDALLAYAQSYSFVDFLLERHGGPERMSQLMAAFRASGSIEAALRETYGFDQHGLDAGWRRHVGLRPRPTPTPSDTDRPVPTLVPFWATPSPVGPAATPTRPAATPTPTSGAGGGLGCNAGGGATSGGVDAVALCVVLGGAAALLRRRV
ncbi:MAG: hypothetical protein FJ318_04395 [SAR202 cluster bacterium]|nr:hypothetical protein [SAR202 cluster bacterium]